MVNIHIRKSIGDDISIINEELVKNVNIAILAIHIGLLIAFSLVKVPVMIVMNIISIIIYILLFKIINKNLVLYLLVLYTEILLHMTVATMTMGWKCGFQLYFFTLIPVIYYCDYVSKKRHLTKIHPVILCVIAVATFFFIRTTAYNDSSFYTHLSETTEIILFTINTVMIFSFLMFFMSMFEQMSLKNEIALQHMADYDLLTNLSNRHRMTALFDELIRNKIGFSVAILDIDDFKKVNDTYGHGVGDKALKAFADVLKSAETDNIYTCRWGGEEFLVVLAGDNTYETAKALLELIRVNVSNIRIPTDTGELKITVSSGIAKYHEGERSSHTINRADEYLYIAKKSGKNQIIANEHFIL